MFYFFSSTTCLPTLRKDAFRVAKCKKLRAHCSPVVAALGFVFVFATMFADMFVFADMCSQTCSITAEQINNLLNQIHQYIDLKTKIYLQH